MAGKSGIEVAAQNVTIDLGGFTLLGVPGSVQGIRHSGVGVGLHVHDGTVEGWGSTGINVLANADGRGNSFTRVTVRGCGGYGFNVAYATLTECAAIANTGRGMELNGETIATRCLAAQNGAHGFISYGLATFDSCTASFNGWDGISAGSGINHVRNCLSVANGNNGITAFHGAVIEGNTCRANGTSSEAGVVGAGIHVSAGIWDVRVEGNHVSENDYGIKVDGTGCFVIRNTARGNTVNITVGGSNNSYGPIVTTTGQINSSSPWANFAN